MQEVPLMEILHTIPIGYVMWGVFGVTLIIFSVYSAILIWHWRVYSTGKFTTVSNLLLYLGVSMLFIAIMAFSAFAYSFI